MAMSKRSQEDRDSSSDAAVATRMKGKSDPRMQRAVSIRLANPHLSLFEALKEGGFDYPIDSDQYWVDSEFVTLKQRKNQLSRRLRQLKRKSEHDDAIATATVEGRSYDDNLRFESSPHGGEQISERKHSRHDHMVHGGGAFGLYAQRTLPAQGSLGASLNMPHQNTPLHFASSSTARAPEMAEVFTHQNSATALGIIERTASRVGMPLDQFAQLLRSNVPLLQANLGPSEDANRKRVALALYQNQNRALLEQSMLLAGYQPEQAREGSPEYIKFAQRAHQEESERLNEASQSIL